MRASQRKLLAASFLDARRDLSVTLSHGALSCLEVSVSPQAACCRDQTMISRISSQVFSETIEWSIAARGMRS